jgi:hypothetical protein
MIAFAALVFCGENENNYSNKNNKDTDYETPGGDHCRDTQNQAHHDDRVLIPLFRYYDY